MKQLNDLGTETGGTNLDGSIDPEAIEVTQLSDEDMQEIEPPRNAAKLYGTPVWLHLDTCFDAAVMYKCNTYERGTVLHTAHPRQWTNATIMGVHKPPLNAPDLPIRYRVLTDIGNYLYLTVEEMKSMYLPPDRRRVTSGEVIDWNQVL
ncbi:hypothetical protein WAJ79_14565 [Acinetobacter baumannii]